MKDFKSNSAYFFDRTGAEAFNRSFTQMLKERQQSTVAKYVSPKNVQRLRHGGTWEHPGKPEVAGELKSHSAIVNTSFLDLINNDLSAIDRALQHLDQELHGQFARMIYTTLSDSCERIGNTVSTKAEGSLENAFMAIIEKIEFSANKNGEVTLPEIHASPEICAKMIKALEAAPAEFKERVETLNAKKVADALAREVERKTKFVRYGEN